MSQPRFILIGLLCSALLQGCASTQPMTAQSVSSANLSMRLTPNPPLGNIEGNSDQALARVITATKPYTLDLTQPADDVWQRIRNGFAIPNLNSPFVVEREASYLTKPEYFLRTVARSSRYLYYVVEQLEKRNMPTELALLPFVESAYNPMAYSRARASGIWQFIPSTGKSYNLKQDWWQDERRDVIASTNAALNYLQALYEMHGDWHLALASYNWGEGSVKRAIEKNRAAGKPTDYQSLHMPEETRQYIPRLQAIKNIIGRPEVFGIDLPHIDNQPYFATVSSPLNLDIKTAARLAEMPLEEFKALNPSFNRPLIRTKNSADSNPILLLPTDKVARFRANLDSQEQGPSLASWQTYNAKKGERVDQIAAKFGMSVAGLRDVNSLTSKARLTSSQVLLVRQSGKSVKDLMVEAALVADSTAGSKASKGIKATKATKATQKLAKASSAKATQVKKNPKLARRHQAVQVARR